MLGGKSRNKQRGFNWLSFTSLDCVEVISSVVRIAEAVRVRRVVEGRLDVREGTSEVSDAGLRDGNDDFRFCGLNFTCNNRFGDGRCRISGGRDDDGLNSRFDFNISNDGGGLGLGSDDRRRDWFCGDHGWHRFIVESTLHVILVIHIKINFIRPTSGGYDRLCSWCWFRCGHWNRDWNNFCNNRFGDGRCRISDGRDGDGFNSRGRLCNWGGFSYRLNCLNYGSGRNLRCFRGGRLNAVTIFICLVIDALRSSLSVVKPGIC